MIYWVLNIIVNVVLFETENGSLNVLRLGQKVGGVPILKAYECLTESGKS